MAESNPAIVGVQSCGCITYANARPDDLHRDDERALAQIVREGGQVIRTTVGEARAMPHFLAAECPHDPKGWEPEPYDDPNEPKVLSFRRVRDVSRVWVRVPGWAKFSAGEVRKWKGKWWATEGWFNYRSEGAHYGDDPCAVLGPFDKQREAADALLPLALERSQKLRKSYRTVAA